MAKKTVGTATLEELAEEIFEFLPKIQEIAEALDKRRVDDRIDGVGKVLRAASNLSKGAAALVSALVVEVEMQEQKREIEAMVREQIRLKAELDSAE